MSPGAGCPYGVFYREGPEFEVMPLVTGHNCINLYFYNFLFLRWAVVGQTDRQTYREQFVNAASYRLGRVINK